MIEDGHKGLEAMSAACTALKMEQWGEAERRLRELQEVTQRLLRGVGDKTQAALMGPQPDKGDRG
jgi:hypothetical protein